MHKATRITRILLLMALWLAPAVAAPATIQGILYISPSGELEGDLVMRAAQTEVLLLRGSGAFETALAKLRENRIPMITKQLQVVRQGQEQLRRATVAARDEIEMRSSQLRQERLKLEDLTEAYEKEVAGLLAEHMIAKTVTDSEGKFSFSGIAQEPYFVHSHFEIVGMDIHYYWLVPVEWRGEKPAEVTLTKRNATRTF